MGKLILSGLPASGGIIIGNLRAIVDPSDADKIDEKCIIVVESTNPQIAHVIIKYALAIVTEKGGILSHAAILARELGIPCVVQVPNALTHLKNYKLIQVDGDHGTISVQSFD